MQSFIKEEWSGGIFIIVSTDMFGLNEMHPNGSVSEEELKINGFQYQGGYIFKRLNSLSFP